MNIKMIVGAILIVTGFIGIAICYLGARDPREPRWAGDMVMGSFFVPFVMGCGVLGVMLVIDGLIKRAGSLNTLDIIAVIGTFAAGAAIYFMMQIKKRLATFDAMRNSPEIIALQSKRGTAEPPDTPANPLDRAA